MAGNRHHKVLQTRAYAMPARERWWVFGSANALAVWAWLLAGAAFAVVTRGSDPGSLCPWARVVPHSALYTYLKRLLFACRSRDKEVERDAQPCGCSNSPPSCSRMAQNQCSFPFESPLQSTPTSNTPQQQTTSKPCRRPLAARHRPRADISLPRAWEA